MPELPEVETVARGVDARVRGDRVEDVWFGSHREPFKTPAARQADGLRGRRIISVHRTGKHIVMELGDRKKGRRAASSLADMGEIEAQWIVHLGMTGRLLVTTPEAPVVKHTHARLTLESGRELRFVDPRRFGRLDFRDLGKAAGKAKTDSQRRVLEPLINRTGGVCKPVSRPKAGDQGRAAEPDTYGGRGKYLCRRELVPGWHSSPAKCGAANAPGT